MLGAMVIAGIVGIPAAIGLAMLIGVRQLDRRVKEAPKEQSVIEAQVPRG